MQKGRPPYPLNYPDNLFITNAGEKQITLVTVLEKTAEKTGNPSPYCMYQSLAGDQINDEKDFQEARIQYTVAALSKNRCVTDRICVELIVFRDHRHSSLTNKADDGLIQL